MVCIWNIDSCAVWTVFATKVESTLILCGGHSLVVDDWVMTLHGGYHLRYTSMTAQQILDRAKLIRAVR